MLWIRRSSICVSNLKTRLRETMFRSKLKPKQTAQFLSLKLSMNGKSPGSLNSWPQAGSWELLQLLTSPPQMATLSMLTHSTMSTQMTPMHSINISSAWSASTKSLNHTTLTKSIQSTVSEQLHSMRITNITRVLRRGFSLWMVTQRILKLPLLTESWKCIKRSSVQSFSLVPLTLTTCSRHSLTTASSIRTLRKNTTFCW